MSERMTPIPFAQLMTWLFAEHDKTGAAFGVTAKFINPSAGKTLPLFCEKLETPLGPAAGPHTQLAQNIIAAYYAGSRFFELKTVQKMDGAELAACIARPCISAEDEGYNCEWSTELYVPQAFDEYVKAWFALRFIAHKWGLGAPNGFAFNISVGYDLEGIQTPKMQAFIDGMIDASATPIFKECTKALCALFPEDADFVRATPARITSGVTVSTLHGCPPDEIEAIASYLLTQKKLNTFVKCNPTILGYEWSRARLDALGYDYLSFDRHHFEEDLQYADAVPMFRRLQSLAQSEGLEFGLKLSNTFPVEVKAGELPSEEMYMSGRAVFPLTIEMARRLSAEFKGALRLSYSGGADYFNIEELFRAGIWPITVATTLLKPGGYNRIAQLAAKLVGTPDFKPFAGVDYTAVAALSDATRTSAHYRKAIKPLPSRKLPQRVPLFDCFTAPCQGGCPIGQDIPEYIELCGKGEYLAALELILQKNPLPFITGTICAHRCMDTCTRNFYEESVQIRATKLQAAQHAYDALLKNLQPPAKKSGPKAAIIGGGPAGIAAAYFLACAGVPVTVFEKQARPGGIVRNVIPEFRIAHSAIDKDVELARRMGAEFICGQKAPGLAELKAQGYEYFLLAVGAEKPSALSIPGNVMNVIEFLYACKNAPDTLSPGRHVAIVGGGNTAMDAARAAKRLPGVERVTLVYRRTKKYMPADAEELDLAIADGVEFAELLSPARQENGVLHCHKVALGEPDESGRRRPVETGETAEVPADIVIAALGEKLDEKVFAAYGVTLNEKGRAPFQTGAVFVAGDALRGPATVVEAIADAAAFAKAVLGQPHAYDLPPNAAPAYEALLAKKGVLAHPCPREAERCLGCNTVCETCVGVCPNRANVAVSAAGHAMRQIVHVDYMCNECGNCATFCPYSSRPYKDKFTLFANAEDFADSENDGFMVLDAAAPAVRVRLNGEEASYDLSKSNPALNEDAALLMRTVLKDYAYLL
ncbi:MAG: putative selenate reductase subunit YgfK [Christensenellaceae bacterium]|jgi:putative selenate reductase|nr:putative selenate reductase subunit YgfK [Christensenellaceae bacterium]